MNNIRSPKQKFSSSSGKKVQRYYAAFSPDFVQDMVQLLGLKPQDIILDPWNGSGTTTAVASRLGIRSYGYDLNPAVQLLAKARLAKAKHFQEAKKLFHEIFLPLSGDIKDSEAYLPSFGYWFSPSSIKTLESLKKRVEPIDSPYTKAIIDTAIVNSIREQLKVFKSKNPAWLKIARHVDETLSLEFEHLKLTAWDELLKLETLCQPFKGVSKASIVKLAISDAKKLPLPNNSIDAVITSPPYCTRIDYVIATLIELAWLGKNQEQIKNLRATLIGTPTVKKASPTLHVEELPLSVQTLLSKISSHPSKASGTYYYKTFVQFFTEIQIAFKELYRVIRPEGQLCIVAQDSYYKEIPIPLSLLFQDMLTMEGFELMSSQMYPAGGLNFIHGHKLVNEVAFTCRKIS